MISNVATNRAVRHDDCNVFFMKVAMKHRTDLLIKSLRDAPWFSKVGIRIADRTIAPVPSWDDAVMHAASLEWEQTLLDVDNALSMHLDRYHTDEYQRWNDIVNEANKRIVSTVSAMIDNHQLCRNAPKKFKRSIINCVRKACLESEYADLIDITFGRDTAEWVIAGHVPCGWEGCWPEGKLMVF